MFQQHSEDKLCQICHASNDKHMPLLQCSPSSTTLGLLKIDIGEVLDTISDPNIPAESVLGAGVVPSSPGGTKWHAARYFLSDKILA